MQLSIEYAPPPNILRRTTLFCTGDWKLLPWRHLPVSLTQFDLAVTIAILTAPHPSPDASPIRARVLIARRLGHGLMNVAGDLQHSTKLECKFYPVLPCPRR